MPSTIRSECKAFVAQYESVIVALLSNQISPDKICQFIGLCPKTADFKTSDFKLDNCQYFTHKLNEIQVAKKNNTPECALCEFIMTTFSKYMRQNATSVSYY